MHLGSCFNNENRRSLIRLKFLGETKGGSGFPDNEQGLLSEELPFFKVKDLAQDKSEKYLYKTNNSISYNTAKKLRAFVFQKNSIVFAKVGAALLLHRFKLLGQPSCIDNNMMGFMVKNDVLDQRYAMYAFSLFNFEDIVNPGAVPSLNEEQINNQTIPIAAIEEQRQIADFLDHETTCIDSLIDEKNNLLNLLTEKRLTIIESIVTRGINPMVKLKDFGISWLKDMPEHWEHSRVAYLFSERDERNQPDLPLLVVSINSGVTLRKFSDDRIENMAADASSYKVARKGDISFNKMRMWQGAVGVSPTDGLVSPDYVVAEPIAPMDVEYFGLLFKTPIFNAETARRSHGITWDRLRLYWEDFRDIRVPLPPVEEQTAIVRAVKEQTSKLDALKEATESTIALLRERRTALIAAAVTGKIEIGV